MITLIIAEALVFVFIASLIILIMTTETAPRRRPAVKRVSLAVLILGAFVLVTACSAIHSGTGATGNSAKKPAGYVKRATFTTAIKNREPTNNISELHNHQQKIYYFTDLRGMQGQKVKHRWIYKGKVMAEVEFKVKGPRWRAYSSKWLERGWLGDWTVSTIDRRGRTLSRNRFSYTEARGIFGKAGKLYDELFGED
jgi:hypothetical protein